jgi:hypothetical protein
MNQREAPRAFLNHVAMIESKIEAHNSPTYNKKVQLPATIFNRSPLRERFGNLDNDSGNNNGNTNGRCSPSKKTVGFSPLRSRRMENNQPNIIRMTSRER